MATALLQNLIERGLRVDAPLLFVIDGGKGLRKALSDVFGDRAVEQRCQVHKACNVRDHLPKERQAHVRHRCAKPTRARAAKTAKMMLGQLASWLETNGEDSAAASLREGLDETLTVLRLGLPTIRCRTFSTTNAIENMNGTLRRVIRNVKRWQGEAMIQRWIALGVAEAQRGLRRVKRYACMKHLLAALQPNKAVVDESKAA